MLLAGNFLNLQFDHDQITTFHKTGPNITQVAANALNLSFDHDQITTTPI
jgi:hypothetical protein